MRPESPPLGAQPRNRFLLAALALTLLVFLATLPWQIRNWREASALHRDASRQQARIQQLQQARDALSHAQAALRAAPNDPNARLAVATELAQSRDFPGAAVQLRALEPAAMRSPELADAVAGLYQQIGYIDRAVALARQARRLAPNSPQTLLRLAVVDTEIGRQTEAHALLLRAVSLTPADAAPHIALALDAIQEGDLPDATKELATARRLRPADWKIASLMAENLSAVGRGGEALQAVADALRLAPQEPRLYAQQAALLLEQTRAKGGKENSAPAVQAAQECLSLDPDNVSAHDTLGQAYLDAGEDGDARREWERAYALDPSYPGLRFHLGRLRLTQGESARGRQILAEDQRANQDAAQWNRLVIMAGSAPNDPARHRQAAQWCQSHHRLSRAIFEWQEVLALLPQDSEAKRRVAQLLAQRG